ncbi:unnamed protein product [Symbiodinium necroappetens]|uniref:Uncharacterized protein n=1 Tax=Symbiodinium necroappetens TaxID=1628268 RepID=A0A812PAP2_9DINO|nr:unnamed protein product [Symbiodinium necroappetens]
MGKKSGGGKKGKPVQTVKSLKAKAKAKGRGQGKAKAESVRQQARHEAKEVTRASRGRRRAHGKEEAINETRQRLRTKLLQRQLTRGPAAKPGEERRGVLVELAKLQTEAGQQRSAIKLLQEALDMSPDDTDFQVRTPLLALYMDRAMTEEASSMLKGPLFEMGADAEAASNAKREAATVGLYSLALLSYIKIHVLQDCKKKDRDGKKAEVLQRLQAAHRHNPFVAEYIAFAPAFEQDFPLGCELPPAASEGILERKLLEALRYCCQLGGRGQISVWQDSGPFVRKFVREALFEGEAGPDATTDVKGDETEVDEPPPLPPLPAASSQEPPVLTRWRRAREAAMQLWASDIATEAGLGEGQEECEEEEVSFTDDDAVDDDVC